MQLPIININGTDRDDLLKDYLNAKSALEKAANALSAVWPHGRDYQTTPNPATALIAATQEHAERLTKVRSVIAEIETIAESLV